MALIVTSEGFALREGSELRRFTLDFRSRFVGDAGRIRIDALRAIVFSLVGPSITDRDGGRDGALDGALEGALEGALDGLCEEDDAVSRLAWTVTRSSSSTWSTVPVPSNEPPELTKDRRFMLIKVPASRKKLMSATLCAHGGASVRVGRIAWRSTSVMVGRASGNKRGTMG
jgi:hypothetical protein